MQFRKFLLKGAAAKGLASLKHLVDFQNESCFRPMIKLEGGGGGNLNCPWYKVVPFFRVASSCFCIILCIIRIYGYSLFVKIHF